jgi:hypothetical protein
MSAKTTMPNRAADGTCVHVREFRRLKYFYGQMLGVQDFQAEQDFFRDKLKLHNRCLHGYGVVCGLLVEPLPLPIECMSREEEEEKRLRAELDALLEKKAAGGEADPVRIEELRRQLGDFYKQHCKEEPRTRVRIDCGVALDCGGNELIVRRAFPVDLLEQLSDADRRRVKEGADTLYLSLCYCEQPVDPVRPVVQDICGATPECAYGKLQDSIRVRVTVDPPPCDTRCETCCEPCPEACLLLARIDCFCPGHPLRAHQIHNEVRRPLSLYPPTTITGISWRNGHHYTQEEAKDLMGTHRHGMSRGKGLEIRFSRPVLASTIHPGVIDTWVIEGGRGRSANIYHKAGEFVDKPHDGTVERIFYRDVTDETLEPGDRVLVILRTNFILDECCRPVDGEHVGGRVPLIREYAEKYNLHPHHGECHIPPKGYGPWTSGNGTPGGTFESWFHIREREAEEGSRQGGIR